MIQLQVLNKILQDQDPSIITLNNLTEDYFSDFLKQSDYSEEFKFIKNHLDTYGKIPDLTTFISKFPEFEVIQVNEPTKYLLDELVQNKLRRDLTLNYNKLRNLLMDGDSESIEKAISLVKQASDLTTNTLTLNCVDLIHDKSRYEHYEEKTLNPQSYFISTGFKELDDLIGGWDVEEELATIVARTGMGKSWILFKSAAAAAMQGKNVGIFSGEMSVNKVGYRIDTLIGNLPNGSLIHGGASVRNDYKKFIDNLPNNVSGKLWVLHPTDLNRAVGVSDLKAFIQKYKLDILFVDQHSLLADDRKGRTDREQAENISKDLKLLQVTEKIPIITVSQQNRTTVEGQFDTTQVARTDRIAQDSTTLIFIDRRDKELFKLYLAKARDTENDKVLSYKVDLNTGKFVYIPDGSDTSALEDSGYFEDDVF